MMTISIGYIFRAEKRDGPILPGLHRVVQVLGNAANYDCPLVVIQIPEKPPPRQIGKKQASYYSKGFKHTRLEALHQLLDEGKITEASAPEIPPWWSMSDAELLALCPEKRWVKQGELLVAPEVQTRDKKWIWIDPLVSLAERKGVSSLVELDALVPARARELGIGPNQIFDALHRYYAFGENKDALLPNSPGGGGKGQERYGRNGVRLGAPNQAAKEGNALLAGKICDQQDRQNIRDGYLMFVRSGVLKNDAFNAFSSTFYSDGYKNENGHKLPLLLPAHQRPTEREFFDHGPVNPDRESTLRRMFGDGEWAKNLRPLIGSARDGVFSIGQVGSLDASPIDVNLVTCFDNTRPIGVPRGLFVREANLGLWCGAHNVIGGPGTADALLTILRAALGKEKVLRRLGLNDTPPDDFVDHHFTRLLSDNGELRAIMGIETCAKKVRTTIEFVESGRADRNSPSESGHHARHAGLDHKLPGTTYGRQAKRGEPIPISRALLSLYGYERLMWQWMHWSNAKQLVPHLVPTEMKRALAGQSYLPTRIRIYRWAEKEGYVTHRPINPVHLRSNLLPVFKASVLRNGLVIHRPGTGERVELLRDAFFNSEYIEQSCLYHNFGPKDLRHVDVRVDPDDLSEILLVDARGIHVIPNIARDVIVVREFYLPDLVASKDSTRLTKIESRSNVDQAGADLRLSRAAEVDDARTKRKRTQADGSKTSTRVSRDGVRKNQQMERDAQLAQSSTRAAVGNDSQAPNGTGSSQVNEEPTRNNIVPIKTESRLKLALNERMKTFLGGKR